MFEHPIQQIKDELATPRSPKGVDKKIIDTTKGFCRVARKATHLKRDVEDLIKSPASVHSFKEMADGWAKMAQQPDATVRLSEEAAQQLIEMVGLKAALAWAKENNIHLP